MKDLWRHVLLLSFFLIGTLADQPVGCLRKHVHEQVWNFHISKDTQNVNLFQTNEVCTHAIPNKVQIISNKEPW